MMKRLLTIFLVLGFLGFSNGQEILTWQNYKNKYIPNGRYVIDPYNENRVTSESQGYGMILAILNDDKTTFDNLWQWTRKNLQREDYLFSWLWNDEVKDKNNATDGDFLIAYALLKAYEKWGDKAYKDEGEKIFNSLKNLIVIVKDNKLKDNYLLLPATYGFSNEKYDIVIFPSYYITFILKELSYKDNLWKGVYNYTKNILFKTILSTNLKFNLIEKKLIPISPVNLDVYRVIPYTYMAKESLEDLKTSFSEVDSFFKAKGYIPFNYNLGSLQQEVSESPFCVYRFFYLLYNDEKYLERYKVLKNNDKNNYFCDTFELFLD